MSVVLSSETELKKSDVPDLEEPATCLPEQTCLPGSKRLNRESAATFTSYMLFMLAAGFFMREYSDADFSAILTVSSGVQFFGFTLLLHKVKLRQTVAGLSARSMELYALFFVMRLSSTCFKNGYIPVDRSGDWLYQATDIASLMTVLQLLYCLYVSHADTYQRDLDMPYGVHRAVLACFLLGCAFHGSLNHNQIFDVIWQFSLNLDAIALVPQLALMYKIPKVEALNSHFVAAIVVSRALAFWFWFVGMPELAPKDGRANVQGWAIVGAHGFQLVVSAEFMIKYLSVALKETKEALKVLDKGPELQETKPVERFM